MQVKEIKEIILSIFKINHFKVMPLKRIAPAALLLLGLSLLLYQSLISQQIIKLKAIKFQSFSQKKLLAQKNIIAEDPDILLGRLKAVENQLVSLKSKFVFEQDLPKYFDSLRGLISKTDNRLSSLDLKSTAGISDIVLPGKNTIRFYQRLPFNITINGDYIGALLLLNKLEEDPRLLEINNIKIEATQKTAAEVKLDLDLNLYVLKD